MFKPRYRPYATKSHKKRKYARKRQSANVAASRSLYSAYSAPRALSQTTQYPVRRMIEWGAIASSASFGDGLAFFILQSLPDYTEFTALYDQYRVDKLVMHFIPNATIIDHSSSNLDSGTLLTAVDFDGGATGLTLTQFLSYESSQVHKHCVPVKITVQPRAEFATINNSAVTVASGLTNSANIWYDCSNTTVPFYGVRYATTAEATVTGYHTYYKIWMEAFVTFKSTR